jgi:ABC-type sugar transport system ATPase subunit
MEAGKSTMMKILLGVESPSDTGNINFNGEKNAFLYRMIVELPE